MAGYHGDGDEGEVTFTLAGDSGEKLFGEYISSQGGGYGYWSGSLVKKGAVVGMAGTKTGSDWNIPAEKSDAQEQGAENQSIVSNSPIGKS